MNLTPTRPTIHKRDVANTVYFAINYVPQIDGATLERFLELVNATGNFGTMTDLELFQKMGLLKKYIPATCERTPSDWN